MRVLISGASGLVGRALAKDLTGHGHEVRRLVRRPISSADEMTWNPSTGEIDAAALTGVDGIIHLAGENVAAGRWTRRRREAIRASRVEGTRTLIQALARCDRRPRVFVSASAVGIYGARGESLLDEASTHGAGFLASVCQEWEQGLQPAVALGLRTVAVRIGLVLAADGGALAKMIPVFRVGLGGRLGSGRQWMSWIALDDLTRVFRQVLEDDQWTGPVNAVAPGAVRNREFTAALGRVLQRPAVLPVPALGLRLALGAMAEETLLASTRVQPRRLQDGGFEFRYPELAAALRHVLRRSEDK